MLRIGSSNHFEILLDALLDDVGAAPASPFTPMQVIVPSAALRRRVELAVADRFGICANIEFSFLAQWLWRQIGQVVAVAEVSPFTPPVLAWRIYGIFGDAKFVGAHPPLVNYLRHADAMMRYDLAVRTAALLDQYLTYRPDWLAVWAADRKVGLPGANAARAQDERWQAALWRRVARELGIDRQHPSAAFFREVEAEAEHAPRRWGLPAAAYVFCLPTIPPLYIDMLRRLGRWIDVNLYAINPCHAYWFDIVTPRRFRRLAASDAVDHHEVGNRLLAAWGGQSKEQLAVLFDDGGETSVDAERFAASGRRTLLGSVQDAILDLYDVAQASHAPLPPDDRSIEIHVCHSLTRELEVLQDQLLAMFGGPNPPRPSDILVVTPGLDDAAPLIDAVFGNAAPKLRIPYTITGRARSAVNPVARALLELLTLATSRLPVSAVARLLQQPIVGIRFGIDAAAFDAIHGWLEASAIRWGLDAEHRAAFDLPSVSRHTFHDGLERLFLGYALPAATDTPVHRVLPAGNVEGSDALALGCFAQFMQQVERLHHDLARAKSADEWRQTLSGIIGEFLLPAHDEIDDLREVETAIANLHDNMRRGELTQPVTVDVLRAALEGLVDDPARGGVPTGVVTFSSMTSLRSLPYRMVCVLGLNDGAYPAPSRPAEFDLMALSPRRGDRQRRADDRNVFLDLVLAARERLYLSYTGRSIRDNSILPPSVLISDLVDYVVPAIAPERASPAELVAARARLILLHPLQPYAVEYFDDDDGDPRMRSFNGEYCSALRRQFVVAAGEPAGAPQRVRPRESQDDDEDELLQEAEQFFRLPLAAPGDEWRDVTLDQLALFFRQPCRYLLKQRLGIALPRVEEELQDDEPFVVNALERAALGERLLPAYQAGRDAEFIRSLARAGTEYPSGRLGDAALERELALLAGYSANLFADATGPRMPPASATLSFVLDEEPWQLRGGFGDLRATGLVRARYDDVRPRDYLAGWIEHLFLNAMQPAGVAPHTVWHSRDGRYRLRPCPDALAQLQALLALYRAGLRAPLHFFPKAAWNLVVRNSAAKARAAWHGSSERPFGEKRDAAYRLALRGVADPLDGEFEASANAVFRPLRNALDDSR